MKDLQLCSQEWKFYLENNKLLLLMLDKNRLRLIQDIVIKKVDIEYMGDFKSAAIYIYAKDLNGNAIRLDKKGTKSWRMLPNNQMVPFGFSLSTTAKRFRLKEVCESIIFTIASWSKGKAVSYEFF